MSFRLKIVKRGDKEYGQIVQFSWDPIKKNSVYFSYRSLGNLVKARQLNPNFDEEIKAELEELNKPQNEEQIQKAHIKDLCFQLRNDSYSQNSNLSKLPSAKYGIVFYRRLWEKLDLDRTFNRIRLNYKQDITFDLDKYAFFLTSLRLLDPSSKSRTFNCRKQHIYNFSDLSLKKVYSCLDVLAARKDLIIKHLNQGIKNLYDRVETIALYDVTTFHFQSFESDELRARGMSKINLTNEVQVVLGLLIDGEGIPLNYEVFRGNTGEVKTLMEVVEKYKQEHNLQHVKVIADRGLNSYFNLERLEKNGDSYIVAQSISRLKKDVKAQVFDQDNWDRVVSFEDDLFKVKTIYTSTSNTLDNKIIVTWSKKRYLHDLKVLEERYLKSKKLVEQGTAAVDASMAHGSKQFIKRSKTSSNVTYTTNESLYAKRKEYAGYYALITSEIKDDASKIYKDLRRLWQIEECFRVMKTDLNSRPVYVRTEKHIRGHFLMCYIALVLERLSYKLIQAHNIDISNHRLLELLSKLRVTILSDKHNNNYFIKSGNSYDADENEADEVLENQVLSVMGLDKLNAIENRTSFSRKIKTRFPLSNFVTNVKK